MFSRVFLVIFLCAFFITSTAKAADNKTPQVDRLVTITPFLQTVTLPAADPDKTFPVSITNNSKTSRNFTLDVVDFGALDDTGGLVFAGANESKLVSKYGLKSWLALSQNSLTIEAGKTAQVTARIVNDEKLSPGGHYAAVVASVRDDPAQNSGVVSLNQKLTSLVLATKTGGEKYSLRLDNFAHNSSWRTLATTTTLKFKNDGNVHVVPRGTVELKNAKGKVVAKGVINEASSYVLPESRRDIAVSLKPVGKQTSWPGTYRLVATYRYDGYENYASRSLTVRFIPWFTIILLLFGLGFLAAVYYMYSKSFLSRRIARKLHQKLQRK